MTTLIAWIVFTPTGEAPELPRALYLASDSRITWGSQAKRWDAGRKVFSPIERPHLFGYSGDVVFPSLILGQIISALDQGILFDSTATADEKHRIIYELIRASHKSRHNVDEHSFSIIHIHRRQDWPATAFSAWKIGYSAAGRRWSNKELPIPANTGILIALGTGANLAKVYADEWNKSDAAGTSRAIFSAFCDAISSGSDRFSGGVPQLSGLYTKGRPRPFGFVENGRRYMHGLELSLTGALAKVEWRDRLFQDVDPKTMKPLLGARRFARPRQAGQR